MVNFFAPVRRRPLMIGVFLQLMAAQSAQAAPMKSTYCVFSGYLAGSASLAGKTVAAGTHDKYAKIAASAKIDLDVYALKANEPDGKGVCRQPTCKVSGSFGIAGELTGSIETCTYCGLSDYQTLQVEFAGYRFKSPMRDPDETSQLRIEPLTANKPIRLQKTDYEWVYLFCKNEKNAGQTF